MIEAFRPAGVLELVPSYRSLLVVYDPLVVGYDRLRRQLAGLAGKVAVNVQSTTRVLQVPCCYDGPDLADVAQLAGISVNEVIRIHSQPVYRIYMLGFLPGFVYLGGLDRRIHAPRLQSPRKAIPAGSVGIGGSQTGIYPLASPGGWRLIGRTPLVMYDPLREPSIPVKAGDGIRFLPVEVREFEALQAEYASGKRWPVFEEVRLG